MRVKRGHAKKLKHNKVLHTTKGYRMSYSRLYRRALEGMLHAGQYNFAHRRARRGQMRGDWIKIISAALAGTGMSYSQMIGAMQKQGIALDRKILAQMAESYPTQFQSFTQMLSV